MPCCTPGTPVRSFRLFTFTLFTFIAFAAVSFGFAARASAQTLRGHVADQQSRAVVDADVIVSQNGDVVITMKSQGDGSYGPVELPPGEYDVLATAPGMHASAQHVTVRDGADATLNATVL